MTLSEEPDTSRHDMEWHDRVSEIVVQALELPPEEFEDFLRRECGEDAEMMREVRSLLDEDTGVDEGFLSVSVPEQLGTSPNAPVDESDTGSIRAPERVGPYRIGERLGAGGMGAVFLAEQTEPVERRVALKLIRGLQSERARKRFAAECQALAHLNHPNIAAMYEVGSVEGDAEGSSMPYIAMEWIDGRPITDWCDERRLTLRDRVKLFMGVCAGIGHAHENQVLHCDLKPNNVLVTEVDGEALAKVIDFGISRALSDGSPKSRAKKLTTDLFMGSPLYVSPEAADPNRRHRLDTRSDVYSLGVLLYELLVGVLPVERDEELSWSLLHRMTDEPAVAPSLRLDALSAEVAGRLSTLRSMSVGKMGKGLGGDLDAIVLKAMSPDPVRRYASPGNLAADLLRYLRLQPVSARSARPSYVLRRFVARRASAVLAVALVVLALAGGLVARTLEAGRANAQAERARQALVESEQVRDFVVRLFDAADPERGGRGMTVEEVLDRGLDQLETDLSELPLVRATFLLTIGSIYDKLSLGTRAEAALHEALELRLSQLPAAHPDILEARDFLGVILRKARKFEEASEQLELVLEARVQDPEVHPERLALAHSHLGNLRWAEERYDAAEMYHLQALRIRQENDVPPGGVAESANNLGVLLNSQGRNDEALPHLELAAEMFAQHAGPRHADTAAAINNIGLVLRKTPRWREALARFEKAHDIWEEVFGAEHRRTQLAIRNRLSELTNLHRWAAAETLARELVMATREADDSLDHARAYRLLSAAQRQGGDFNGAVASARMAVSESTVRLGAEHRATHRARRELARALLAADDAAAALAEIEAVIEHLSTSLGEDHSDFISSVSVRARILLEQGRTQDAVSAFRTAAAARRLKEGRSPTNYASALLRLATALTQLEEFDEAGSLFEQSRQRFATSYGEEHPSLTEVDAALGELALQQGDRRLAQQYLSQAVRVAEELFPASDRDLANYREALIRAGGG